MFWMEWQLDYIVKRSVCIMLQFALKHTHLYMHESAICKITKNWLSWVLDSESDLWKPHLKKKKKLTQPHVRSEVMAVMGGDAREDIQ